MTYNIIFKKNTFSRMLNDIYAIKALSFIEPEKNHIKKDHGQLRRP